MPTVPAECTGIETLENELKGQIDDLQDQLPETAGSARAALTRRIADLSRQERVAEQQLQACILTHTAPGPPPDGSLITGSEPGTVYLVENGQRHGIPDARTFELLGYLWSAIIRLPDDQLNAIPEGDPLPALTRFIVDSGWDFLGWGHYMQTRCGLTIATGEVRGWTRAQAVTWFEGFHGGVSVVLLDKDQLPVPNGSLWERRGVDGTAIGKHDTGEVPWFFNVSPDDAATIRSIQTLHTWDPDTFEKVLDKWIGAGESILKLLGEVTGISHLFSGRPATDKGGSA